MDTAPEEPTTASTGLRWSHVLLIVLGTIVLTVGITYWVLNHYLFLKEFRPVTLRATEEQLLNEKLRQLGVTVPDGAATAATDEPLEPKPYSEIGASREVAFSERELNAMLARNTDLARKLSVDLSADLLSVNVLIPLDPDFPVLGGKTLRMNAGVELAYREGRPIVILKGVSVMGVPIPNAWLGNLKNVDLAREFGGHEGFWRSFSDGVEHIRVEEGSLLVKSKE